MKKIKTGIPLHVAIDKENTECVKLLLEAGADPNATDNDAYTPLYLAAREGNVECTKLLLEAGADPTDYKEEDTSETTDYSSDE